MHLHHASQMSILKKEEKCSVQNENMQSAMVQSAMYVLLLIPITHDFSIVFRCHMHAYVLSK